MRGASRGDRRRTSTAAAAVINNGPIGPTTPKTARGMQQCSKRMKLIALLTLCAVILSPVTACSNILVSPAASEDGNVLIGANDDSAKRLGAVTHFPAQKHGPGAMRSIYHFETGALSGQIPEPNVTHNVMSHANEHGLVIAETTHGGIARLAGGSEDLLDYGSLIMVTLQRAKTAREAVRTIVALCEAHGEMTSQHAAPR